MKIASYLKQTNIVEYLLYMWQVEDILRAMKFDMEVITSTVINQLPIENETEYASIVEWYENIIEMMRRENIMEKGHLQINDNIVADLEDFHYLIYASERVPAYNAKYIHVLPIIDQFRKKSDTGMTDIELCLTFQYGILMLKLQKKEISEETLKSQEEISKYLVLLAKNYHAYAEGKLDLE